MARPSLAAKKEDGQLQRDSSIHDGNRGCLFTGQPAKPSKKTWRDRDSRTDGAMAAGQTPVTIDDMRDLFQDFKAQLKEEILSDLKQDIQHLSQIIHECNRNLDMRITSMSEDVKILHDDMQTSKRSRNKATCVSGLRRLICGGKHSGDDSAGSHDGITSSKSGTIPLVPEEPRPSLVPMGIEAALGRRQDPRASSIEMAGHGRQQSGMSQSMPSHEVMTDCNRGDSIKVSPPVPRSLQEQSGLLGPVVKQFEAAIVWRTADEAKEVQREPFVDGLEAYAAILNKMGANLGSYLLTNTKKLRNSKANKEEGSYRAWLFSELPVHAANGYKEYVDESAFMANLWIGWTLEFFVEWFALLDDGRDTKQSIEVAYKQTLHKHHNFMQKAAFSAAMKRLPNRQDLLKAMQGDADEAAVTRDISNFVCFGRPIVRFCLDMDKELSSRLQAERKAYRRK